MSWYVPAHSIVMLYRRGKLHLLACTAHQILLTKPLLM